MALPRTLAVLVLLLPLTAQALTEPSHVSPTPQPGAFPIATQAGATPILVDKEDWPGVLRAAHDLAADIHTVTNQAPRFLTTAKGETILIGTIGRSPLIDRLIAAHKLNVDPIRGHWETSITQIVDHPLPGVPRALVLAGADKRGTIFAIYDLSEQIGVSPWAWWADVPTRHQDALYVLPGQYLQPEPVVKYRGIFLNDEAPALTGLVHEKFGGFTSKFYVHVFELLLRLKANFLWPAMWNSAFNEDDPADPKLADEYGIVMGTSHHEPMMRAQQEWKRHGTGPWDYSTNAAELDQFWREGVRRNRNYEELTTIAMRGDGDMAMSASTNTALLEKIVADQRRILSEEVNPDVTKVPQVWALYKEVQDYYEAGMRVPDDVTLLWCDDNWGNLRRLPTPEERKRPGGAGIYYHFDYVGGPRNYKWLNTNPIPKVYEQMNLAVQYGATRMWIVNVGDLKPMEFPIEFFLDMARTPSRFNPENLQQFTEDWATRDFGPEHAKEIAQVVSEYTKYNGRRKPELIDANTFPNEDEANRILSEYQATVAHAEAISKQLPPEYQDAFFELVLWPAKASETALEMNILAGQNHSHARRGLADTNDLAARVKALFAQDAALTAQYNAIHNGKWDHMADQTHLGYFYWQEPPVNIMPPVSLIDHPHPTPIRSVPPQPAPSIPADFHGFVETNGVVSIEAEHFTASRPGASAHWQRLPDYGETLSAMTLFPVTAPSTPDPAQAACLDYALYLTAPGDRTVEAILAPTLPFVPKRGLRYSLGIDGQPAQIVDIWPAEDRKGIGDDRGREWATAVSDGVNKVSTPVGIPTSTTPGPHTLHFCQVDPGVVLEKLVLTPVTPPRRPGPPGFGPAPFYLGPPESPRQ